MTTRRLEKAIRVIKESVSDTVLNRLSDPRICGLVTVTEVDVSPDMKQATVYLSVAGVNEPTKQLTLKAIGHAAGVIQAALGRAMRSKYVPHLLFKEDQKLKKTLETLRLIEQARTEWEPSEDDSESTDEDSS